MTTFEQNLDNLSKDIKTCTVNMENGRHTAASLKLASIKMKTIPILGKPRYLTAEEHVEATQLVHEMNAKGWLTEDDVVWAFKNGIEIESDTE